MRLPLLCLGVLVLPGALAHGEGGDPWPPANHGPQIQAIVWDPMEPARGQDVDVIVVPKTGANVTNIHLVYCRVQRYACATAITMTSTGQHYETVIPWNKKFFDDAKATQVGINLTVELRDASDGKSPVANWPATPPELPADAGLYYFYRLPEPTGGSPGPGAALAVFALVLLALVLPRSRR